MAVGNYCSFTGRLASDPACFTNGDGSKKYKMTIACQRNYKNAEGNYDADFVNVEAFVNAAAKGDPWAHLSKGSQCQVEGSVRSDHYTDKTTGEEVYTQVIRVTNVKFLDSKRAEGTPEPAAVEAAAVAAAEQTAAGVPMV